ncbi:Protein 60A [Eufriesea mexicana]|uniref:Protein 60A n=1 Tax=Eufriesea mexicana TaxID=516756 RepID=A0A310S5S8_9HYME|nr:Protein 60A [Eufriesea mexicana]
MSPRRLAPLLILGTILAGLTSTAAAERMSGLYVDNGFDQTIVHRVVSQREKREVEHEILNLLGLPDRPRSTAGRPPQVKRSAPKFLLDIYKNALGEDEDEKPIGEQRRAGEFDLTGQDLRAIDQSDVIMTFAAHIGSICLRFLEQRTVIIYLSVNTNVVETLNVEHMLRLVILANLFWDLLEESVIKFNHEEDQLYLVKVISFANGIAEYRAEKATTGTCLGKAKREKEEPVVEERNGGIGARTGSLIGGFESRDTLKMFSVPIDIINTLVSSVTLADPPLVLEYRPANNLITIIERLIRFLVAFATADFRSQSTGIMVIFQRLIRYWKERDISLLEPGMEHEKTRYLVTGIVNGSEVLDSLKKSP